MSVEIRPLDITSFKGDAIVNSLGIRENIKIYGKICKNILKAADSKELEKKILEQEQWADPGYMFITKGYKLPAKNIIHIATPYYDYDNQLEALEFAYKLALVTAFKKGWTKIALPIIGTGANGYPHAYVLKMLTKLVNAFFKYHKEMDITICMPVVSLEEYNEKFDTKQIDKAIKEFFDKNSESMIRDFEYDESSFTNLDKKDVAELLNYHTVLAHRYGEDGERDETQRFWASKANKKTSFLDVKEVLLDSGTRPVKFDMTKLYEKSVSFYIETYITTRYVNPSDQNEIRKHVNLTVSGSNDSTSLKTKHGKEEKRTTITVPMLMRYVLALHMNMKEANDLLLFCGKIFSPVSEQDTKYQRLISLKKYVTHDHDRYVINGYCLENKIEQIFGYEEISKFDEKIDF